MAASKADKKKDDGTPRVTFERFENPMQDYIAKNLSTFSSMVRVMPYDAHMVDTFEGYHERHVAFPCRPQDVWVTSFPKSGTTWTQELVWLLLRGLGHEDGGKILLQRFPYFEWDSLLTPKSPPPPPRWDSLLAPKYHEAMALLPEGNVERWGEQWKILEQGADPRMIKSHLHRGLLPREVDTAGARVVYVMRDPRDVCVSLYHHTIKILDYRGDLQNFVRLFLNDLYVYQPYWSNVLSYWDRRHEGNILLLRYEELQQDLAGSIKRVAGFLGVSVAPEKLSRMVERLSFEAMSKNPATNNENMMKGLSENEPDEIKFMRKGIIGDYKNHLSEEQTAQFTKWTEKWLKDSDFPYYRY